MSIGKSTLGLAGWLVATFAAAWIGSRYMPGAWYASLTKPSWNPPNAIFGPVWTVLYVLMAVAAWLVWRKAGFSGAGAALSLFIVQLALNALWSYLFFGQHRPDLAFLDIIALWAVILVVAALFWRVDPVAGGLMVPYLAWVSFASYLNFVLWRLNRGIAPN
jgi:tryptophan-rich sensory protein